MDTLQSTITQTKNDIMAVGLLRTITRHDNSKFICSGKIVASKVLSRCESKAYSNNISIIMSNEYLICMFVYIGVWVKR